MVFFNSELGERVTLQFNAFNELLCQSEWYLLPLDVQRMLVIFMMDTEQPAVIQGYGNIECTRASFKKVDIFAGKQIEFDLKKLLKILFL